jgi:hypothetical protein
MGDNEQGILGKGGQVMLRKFMIALAATTFMGAMAVATTADARSGGHGGGGHGGHGGRGGGMHMGGGGMHMGGSGMRMGSMRGFSSGPRNFAFNRGSVGHRNFVGSRHFAGHRFHRRSFAAVPFFVGGAYAYDNYYDDGCWALQYTRWGATYVNVCGYDYGYGYGGYW